MGMIRVLQSSIEVELDPEELIGERFAIPEKEVLFVGAVIAGIAFQKLQEKRPALDQADVVSSETRFRGNHFVVRLTMKGNWHEKIKKTNLATA